MGDSWTDLTDEAGLWSREEFGPNVTERERDERARYGAKLAEAWGQFRDAYKAKHAATGEPALLANTICGHLRDAFQVATLIGHKRHAIQTMEYLLQQPDPYVALRSLMTRLALRDEGPQIVPRYLDFPRSLIPVVEDEPANA